MNRRRALALAMPAMPDDTRPNGNINGSIKIQAIRIALPFIMRLSAGSAAPVSFPKA